MANTFTPSFGRRFGGPNGKAMVYVVGKLVIDTTATGGATKGDLPASLFKLQKIHGCTGIILSDDSKIYFGAPADDFGSLMVGAGASNAPMDLPNGTYYLTLLGIG